MHDTKKKVSRIHAQHHHICREGGSCADAQGAILEIQTLDGGVMMAIHLKLNMLLALFGSCILRTMV